LHCETLKRRYPAADCEVLNTLPGAAQCAVIGGDRSDRVVGFPLLSALALRHVTSAHAIVFVGLLPLATAIFGVLRGVPRFPSRDRYNTRNHAFTRMTCRDRISHWTARWR
jgi:hypothetical protein